MQARTPRRVSRLTYASSIAAVCIVLAACGGGSGTSTSTSGDASTSTGSGASAEGYPVTIQNCGRTLTFDQAPSRVVLPWHPIAEIFAGLGLADRTIGRAGYEGSFSRPPTLPEQAADLERIPVVSDNVSMPPKEQMLSLRADFLLAYAKYDYDEQAGVATVDQLQAAGAQVYTVICPTEGPDSQAGETLEGVYRTILDLGKIFNVQERAQERVTQMNQQIAEVREKVKDKAPVTAILYGGGSTGPLNLEGEGIDGEILAAAGGQNVFPNERAYFQASLESVAARPVDAFVIFPDFANPTASLDATDEARFLFETFPDMPATKNRRIVVTAYEFTSTSWRIADTVEDIARQLHPGAFDQPSDTHQYTDADE